LTVSSFYELTEEEVQLLLDALELFRTEGEFSTGEEVKLLEELYHFLKTRERR